MVGPADNQWAMTAMARIFAKVPVQRRGSWQVMDWLDDHDDYWGFGLPDVAARVLEATGLVVEEDGDDDNSACSRPTGPRRFPRQRHNGWRHDQIMGVLRQPGDRVTRLGRKEALSLLRRAARVEHPTRQGGAVTRATKRLANLFETDAAGQQILTLLTLSSLVAPLEHLMERVLSHGLIDHKTALAAALALPFEEVEAALAPSARLVDTGLVRIDGAALHGRRGRGAYEPQRAQVDDAIVALAQGGRLSAEAMRAQLVGPAVLPELGLTDFDHLAADGDLALRLLRQAGEQRLAGINILLYGAPGTGKTEFAKVLAREAGLSLHAAGVGDVRDKMLDREDRLQHLRQLQSLLGPAGGAAILFDEMEDLLEADNVLSALFEGPKATPTANKAQVHTVLETTTVPVIWTCNSIERFDPALLRRMVLAIPVPVPPAQARERVWNRAAHRAGLDLSGDILRQVAHDYEAAPAVAAGAFRAAAALGGSEGDVRRLVGNMLVAINGGRPAPPRPLSSAAFDPTLINADTDLVLLADRLAGRADAAGPVSLLLHGPPGTGKSAFGRYLAQRLGLDVLEKRGSDLFGKYVGQTEQAIAGAFAQARDSNALLILDEVDSLLGSRAGAQHSWEVSQVNEMLQWLEAHPLPLVATTNRLDTLDPAALRRFAVKVGWHPLDPRQRALAFRHFFGVEAPGDLRHLDGLTPGDFHAAGRKAQALGVGDPRDLVVLLRDEQALKPDRSRPIGFGAA